MFKSMKLGAKLALGFGTLIVVAVVLGGIAVVSMGRVKTKATHLSAEYVPEVEILSDLERSWLGALFAVRGFGYTGEEQMLAEGRVKLETAHRRATEALALAEKSTQLAALKTSAEEIESHLKAYDEMVGQTDKEMQSIAATRIASDPAAAKFMESCDGFVANQNKAMTEEFSQGAAAEQLVERLRKNILINEVIALGNAVRISNWKGQALRDTAVLKEALGSFDSLKDKMGELRKITRQEVNIKELDAIDAAAAEYRACMEKMIVASENNAALGVKRVAQANTALALISETSMKGIEQTTAIAKDATAKMSSASTVMVAGLILAVIIGVLLAYFLTRSITKPIHNVIAGMSQGSEQVSSASGQVAQSSQQMAEGASEQASSLEEVSASLEEMTSMTRQNAENAQQSNTMANESRTAAQRGSDSVKRMAEVIQTIKKSSDETAKIVKTIDEIAFQTNLLALNAAVEAARAGEAGKGFAVVAEEVRNLAQRSAQAAKTTAELIEGAQKNADNGVAASTDVAGILQEIVNSVGKVTQLIAEVSAASNEQSKGIEQINSAISQMDKVTQSNAANAEESASASEQLSAQSRELKDMVGVLINIVGGAAGQGGAGYRTASHASTSHALHRPEASTASANRTPQYGRTPQRPAAHKENGSSHSAVAVGAGSRSAKPEEVIPLDEEDFKDF